MNDDAELLRRYVEERSEEAFTELVQRRIALVYSVANRHTGDSHRAADAAQKVFTALARNAARLSRQPVLVGWFYRSAHHAALNVMRDEARRARHEQEAMQTIQQTGETDWQTVTPILDEVISDLGEKDRDAVLLRFFDALPFAEIGRRLGLSENAARMRVERALDKLHGLLGGRGITSTTGALALALSTQVASAAPPQLAVVISSAAVASAATNSSAVTATTLLMNKPALIAATAAMLAIGTAVYQSNAAQQAGHVAASYRHENEILRARLTVPQTAATSPAAEPRVSVGFSQPAGGNGAAAETTSDATTTPGRAEGGTNAAKPKAVRAERDGKSASAIPVGRLDNWYTAMYQQLNLSPAQIDQFKALAKENARRHEQLDELATTQGFKVTDPDVEEFYVQADAELHAKLAATFGEAAAKEMKLFTDQLPLRDVAAQINNMLLYTDNMLTVPQTNALVAMMWEHMRDASGKITVKLASTATTAMRTKAQEILSAAQYPIFRDWMDQLDKQNQATAGTPK